MSDTRFQFEEEQISIYVPLAGLALIVLFAAGVLYQLLGLLF